MNHEVPKPSHKMTLLIRDEHTDKCGRISAEIRRRTGEHVSCAFIIDHLLAEADELWLIRRLIAKVKP